jgi:RPA family protein
MITEDIENIRKNGFDVEEMPTGYIFTKYSGQGEAEQASILIDRETCGIIQKIGKIEEIQVVDGERVRIVVLRAIIGSG